MPRVLPPTVLILALAAGAAPPALAESGDREARLLAAAGTAFEELLETPDREVPKMLLERCRCIAVFPGVVKGALGWGGRRGHGVISCRDSARWSPPSFMTITGGSFGFQIGVEKSDLVLFVVNAKGARSLLESGFSLGAKGGVAAGPLGRSVEGGTDLKLDAEIYSYARAKGLFAGLSLEGARVATDAKAVRRFYGADVEPEALLFEREAPRQPEAAQEFLRRLP